MMAMKKHKTDQECCKYFGLLNYLYIYFVFKVLCAFNLLMGVFGPGF